MEDNSSDASMFFFLTNNHPSDQFLCEQDGGLLNSSCKAVASRHRSPFSSYEPCCTCQDATCSSDNNCCPNPFIYQCLFKVAVVYLTGLDRLRDE